MKWRTHRKTSLRASATTEDGTWYGIYPYQLHGGSYSSAKWIVYRRLAPERHMTSVSPTAVTLAEARQVAEDDNTARTVIEVKAQGWFSLSGRGQVASVASDELPPGPSSGEDLLGKTVSIDGQQYRVMGVEHCLVMHRDQDKRCPRGYGLLVDKVDP